jgi:6-phosphogluconolactonase (cycloisomerase 2 family)
MKKNIKGLFKAVTLIGAMITLTCGLAQAVSITNPLTPIPGNKFSTSNKVMSVVSTSDNKNVYSLNMLGADNLSHYFSDQETGELTLQQSINVETTAESNVGSFDKELAIDPLDRFLFVASSTKLYVYRIGDQGGLSLVASPLKFYGTVVTGMIVSPDAKYLYTLMQWTPGGGSNNPDPRFPSGVNLYSIDQQDGSLTQITKNAASINSDLLYSLPYQTKDIVFSPDGRYLIAVSGASQNEEQKKEKGRLSVYSRDIETGRKIKPISFVRTGSVQPTSLAISIDGEHVYVGESSNEIGVYSFDLTNGQIKTTGLHPKAIPFTPSAIEIAPAGNVLYAIGGGVSGKITSLKILQGYANLEDATPARATGPQPIGMTIGDNSMFIYTANYSNENGVGNITGFKTDALGLKVTGIAMKFPTSIVTAEVSNPTGNTVSNAGFYYGTNPEPSNLDKTITGKISGSSLSASLNISGLEKNTDYFIRPFAIRGGASFFGDSHKFKRNSVIEIGAVKVSDTAIAVIGTTFTQSFFSNITALGYCVTTTPHYSLENCRFNAENSKFQNGVKNFPKTIPLYGLNPNTTYYATAYVRDEAEIYLNGTVQFKTLPSNHTVSEASP